MLECDGWEAYTHTKGKSESALGDKAKLRSGWWDGVRSGKIWEMFSLQRERVTAKAPRQKESWQVQEWDGMPAESEDSKPKRDEVMGDEIRKEGHAAMEIYSQFIGKPLSILKQESNTV